MCSISFALFAIPSILLAIWTFERFKLSSVLRCCAVLQLASTLIRNISILNGEFWPILLGQCLAASIAPFFVVSQIKIVNRWFSEKQRALAQGLMASSFFFGSGSSFGITGSVFASRDLKDATEVKEGV